MFKKVFLLVIISLFLLTGCKDKNDELFIKEESIVKEELKNPNKITEESIKEKYLFLKDNFPKYSKSKKEDFVYNAFLNNIKITMDYSVSDLTFIVYDDGPAFPH